jgi:MoaA/NifB/PqqE/SkfB family radical SAM enzyme
MLFLHFWGWGEPFMNKDIYRMIRYAREKGLKVITSTNGHFLSSEEDIDSLIGSGLDAIIFAMDGADRETYEKFRRRGDFDKMLDNLRLLVKRRMEKGAGSPAINLRMVVTKENEDQISRMREFAASVGVDMLSLKTLGSHDDETLWNESIPRNYEYRRYEYDDAGEAIRKRNTCKRMWHHPFIYCDGTVALCCYHLAGEVPVGNAFASNGDGFSKVWFGQEYRRARAGFMAFRGGNGHSGPERCRTCNTNYTNNWDYVSHAFYLRDNGKTS